MTTSARDLFDPKPGVIYLDAGTYGLPPRPVIDASMRALHGWQDGSADFMREWEPAGEQGRALFAKMIGASTDEIALMPTVSAGVALVAMSLPENANVLIPEEEFTSVALPFYAAEQAGRATVRTAPYTELASAVTPETTLVALSLTRAQSGETADLPPLIAAAHANGAKLLLDTTHATPFVDVREFVGSGGVDYLICHGYKHLLCPRGVGFLYVKRDNWDGLVPYYANWRTVGRSYGGPLDLAPNASRFDISLAWHAWVGAVPALELLVQWQDDGTLEHARELARRLARGLELPEPKASLVCAPVDDPEAAAAALEAAGVKCAPRGKFIRLTPHVYNTVEEIDRAIDVVNAALSAQ